MDAPRPVENVSITPGIDKGSLGPQEVQEKTEVRKKKKQKREYKQCKRKSNKAVAQKSRDLTRELADCKQQLVNSEASKAQLENELSKLKDA
jgi:hypothetical protein